MKYPPPINCIPRQNPRTYFLKFDLCNKTPYYQIHQGNPANYAIMKTYNGTVSCDRKNWLHKQGLNHHELFSNSILDKGYLLKHQAYQVKTPGWDAGIYQYLKWK